MPVFSQGMMSQTSIKDPKDVTSDLANKTVKMQQNKVIVTEEVKIQDVTQTIGKKVAKAGSIIEPNISSREKLDKID